MPVKWTALSFSTRAASGWTTTFTSMLGVVAASNSASLVTKAIFRTMASVPGTTSITLPGTSGNSRPQDASQVNLLLSPPAFRSVTTDAMVMSFWAAERSAALGNE